MRARILGIAAFATSLAGLAASVASAIDYLGPAPTFCAETGCATVRASAWAHPLGVPMPLVGVAWFAIMVALAFVARPRRRLALAIAGAAFAGLLIALQAFAIGAWCKLCMIADPAAIAVAACVIGGAGTLRFTWRRAALAVPAVAGLVLALGALVHAPAPAAPTGPIAAPHEAGAVTVVELVDFECPFCRMLAPRLADAIAHAHAPVRVVRKMMPLPMHPHALDAALAWCCADAQGKGDAMAQALFAAPADDLTRAGCEQIAASVGCDLDRYRRDLPAMAARVAADVREARAAGVHSLPTVIIGDQRIVGAGATRDELVAAIDRAAR
ncbi:MAG: vitamin K epoxide reductase family protein [Acidobacteriota bacterium]